MKKKQSKPIWLKEFDDIYDYHHSEGDHNYWTKVNDAIMDNAKTGKPIPPITFADKTLLNHLNSELEYEIDRMSQRIKGENSGAAHYFRSTYPKYICWMFLCRATMRRTGVNVSEVALSSGLTPNGVRSIVEEASKAGYAYRFKYSGIFHYVASNSSMHAYVDRVRREAILFTEERLRNLTAFQSLVKHINSI